ncbi:MAG: MBL fold metallo-hydrolase, partial [Proteobacteria bacterium]|nr:MBL fold metallo-hydrolase [Pseudomonadota bacterium]
MKTLLGFVLPVMLAAAPAGVAWAFETDVLPTADGELKITFIGHGSLFFQFGGKVIYIDPVGQYGDYGGLPKADLILVAHEHGDHFDPKVIAQLSTDKTKVVLTSLSAAKGGRGIVLKNG